MALVVPREFIDFGRSLVSVCLFASNIFFDREIDYFTANTETWPLIHTWSLAVEEQFYLFFPILLSFSQGLGRRSLILLEVSENLLASNPTRSKSLSCGKPQRKQAWGTPVKVKLLPPPRQSRGHSQFC
jgi:hypothetical protein